MPDSFNDPVSDAGPDAALVTVGADAAADLFDEAFYLSSNPDVREALAGGVIPSARYHWLNYGREEGRPGAAPFDAAWYERAYPWVKLDMEGGRARDLWDHFLRIGRPRGYLPHPAAERPEADRPWTDCRSASDRVLGRRAAGLIANADAAALLHWIDYGCLLFSQALPAALLDAAEAALDRGFRGETPGLLFDCPSVAAAPVPFRPAVADAPAKALDPHMLDEDIRALLFSPSILRVLHLLFETPPLLTQSLGFRHGQARALHRDSAYVGFTRPGAGVGVLIALQDMVPGSGEPTFVPASHHFPLFLFGGKTATISEALRIGAIGPEEVGPQQERQIDALKTAIETSAIPPRSFSAKRGDVLFYHMDLAQGCAPVEEHIKRRSVLAHYCPAEVAPLSFESGRAQLRTQDDGLYYSSVVY